MMGKSAGEEDAHQPQQEQQGVQEAQHQHQPQQQNERSLIREAAQAIAACDFLLVATGAGFSADSGLPTYTQVTQQHPLYQQQNWDYSDFCRIENIAPSDQYQSQQLQSSTPGPCLFYGFWGTCFNTYQQATPHRGYSILKKWCEDKDDQRRKRNHSNGLPSLSSSFSSYYHYTSNVDGYLRRVGFPSDLIHEIHGSIDTWLTMKPRTTTTRRITSDQHTICSRYTPTTDHKKVMIRLPPSFRFPVDKATLELRPEVVTDLLVDLVTTDTATTAATAATATATTTGSDKGSTGTTAKTTTTTATTGDVDDCPALLFRPRVLMFDDGFESHTAMGLQESANRYQVWEEQMEMEMAQSAAVAAAVSCGLGSESAANNTTPNTTKMLVVLEIGCGVRVPSVRQECQDVVWDTATRCYESWVAAAAAARAQMDSCSDNYSRCAPILRRKQGCSCVTHIRINPEDFDISFSLPPPITTMSDGQASFWCQDEWINTISIQGTALSVLEAIDAEWNLLRKSEM